MNPPLRSAADRDAMIEGILDGVVDAIATDHAPHATHEKEVEFEHAPNGITGLETALGLSLRWLHREWKMPLGRVLSLLSAQPAALLNLKGRGTLAVGSFADVVVFDPKAEWTYRATESKSKAKNTPFDGWTMLGKVRWTVSEGRVVYNAAQSEERVWIDAPPVGRELICRGAISSWSRLIQPWDMSSAACGLFWSYRRQNLTR
jgi:dihydroorotase